MTPSPARIAIVGGGPSATYAMERLAATVRNWTRPAEIHVFERTGEFGAGQVHSASQARTSLLNRIAREISFAADESVTDAGPLLPAHLRPSLYLWCRDEFARTGDPVFDIEPNTWPARYLHGLALRSVFAGYVEILCACPGTTVHLVPHEVIDIVDEGTSLDVVTNEEHVSVDHVLLVTGHTYPAAGRVAAREEWARFAGGVFLPTAYPLAERLDERTVPPGSVVGCAGTMLTGVDVILHLTEGRGGRFDDGGYRPSGREPRSIVAFGESGLFAFARAVEPARKRPKRTGVFLTNDAVDRLRESVGEPMVVDGVERRQLDYQRHLHPLVVLEMAYVYYETLLGTEFGDHVAAAALPAYRRFLALPTTVDELLAPVEAEVDAAVDILDGALRGAPVSGSPPWSPDKALDHYQAVVRGQGHAEFLRDNRFDWERTVRPVPPQRCTSPVEYRAALIEFMARDIAWARQGNHVNPAKTSADSVWRGMRPVIVYAVNGGGLTAASHRAFLGSWLRYHNRLAYGPAPEVMAKIRTLIEHGIVDAGTGPGATVECGPDHFWVVGPRTGARQAVDVLVDARVHAFDASADHAPLYPNLLRRGLVSKWVSPDRDGGPGFEPGGLRLSGRLHSIRADGVEDRRLTVIGPAVEGQRFFQGGAMKPDANHHAMHHTLKWLTDLDAQVNGA